MAGLLARSLLVVRKLTLIGPVTIRSPKLVPPRHLPNRAFFKQKKKRNLFNSCIGSQAGRQWRGKRDKRKHMQNREHFLNGNLRMGLLSKVLNQLNIKYKPMQC